MANVIPPPLPPPPPPPPRILNQVLPIQPNPQNPAVAVGAVAAAAGAQAPVSKKPYITIKNLTTVVDRSIARYVDEVKESLDLKELPVIGPSGTSKSTAAPKFERINGDFPELKVDIYEQMVYHRAKSTNTNRLEIFVPTRYKINYDKIKQYFATKGGDKEVQDLINSVIKAYGNNNNSLFYKHTIAGKTAVAAGVASRSRLGTSSGSDLDKLAKERIQNQIDNWHNKYAEWSFYDNASSFFIQNIKLEPDDLLTLKMDFDDVIAGAGAGAGGLVTIVDEISGKYTALKDKYTANIGVPEITTASSTLDTYNKLFERLYAEIDTRKTDPLDYVTERQRDFPSYRFDVNTRNYLLRAFERLHNISQEMKTFENTPINSKIKLLETLNDEYTQLIQGIERDEKLKTANDIFTKYMLGPGRKDGFSNFIPNYKIIQYIFWLIRGGGDVVATDPNANFVNNAFTVDYAAPDVNPEDLYGLIRDLAVAGLTTEDARKQAQFMKDEGIITKLGEINELIAYRLGQDAVPAIAPNPPPGYNLNKHAPWVVTNLKAQKDLITRAINIELDELRNQVGITKFEATKSDDKTAEIKTKVRELKGKHFASMLIFYNYLEAKKANGMAEIAEFFNTFYEDSKLMNPEINSHSSIVGDNPKTVPTFSFGIDILFWTLLRITKYYSDKHINFIKKMKEQIGPENPDLRNLRIEIGVKESKLKHICDLIAKTGEIPIDTIIPDRAGYYIKPGTAGAQLYTGFVDPDLYKDKWHEKIDPTKNRDGTAAKVIYTTNKMNKKLNASLGMTGAAADDTPKMTEMLSRLIELNTIQVVNMLFAKPRNIWYSPDLQIKGSTDESFKWILFQLDRNKIISGRAFKIFKQKLMKDAVVTVGGGGGAAAPPTRIQCILNKAWTTEVQPIVYREEDADPPAFLIFIIATEPQPRMLDKENVKDATDAMLDNPSFSGVAGAAGVAGVAGLAGADSDGVIENGRDFKGALTTTMDKIKGKIIPTKESCATGSDAILNAGKDLNDSFKKTLGSIGIDLEQKVDKFLQKAPPPQPPAMIPPPLPPPPPSAAALATHQAVAQQVAAQQATAVATAMAASVTAAVAASVAAAAAAVEAQTASDQAQAYLAHPNLTVNVAAVAAAAVAAAVAATAAAASKAASDNTATATTLAQLLQLKQAAEDAKTDAETNRNEATRALEELTSAALDAAKRASQTSLNQIKAADVIIKRTSPLPTTVAELNKLRQDISNSLVATARAVADTREAATAAHTAATTMTAANTKKLQDLSTFLTNRALVKLTTQELQLQRLHDHEIPDKIRDVNAAAVIIKKWQQKKAAAAAAAVSASVASAASAASVAAVPSVASVASAASAASAGYKQHLTDAVSAFNAIIIPPGSLPDVPDFDINTAANTANFKHVAETVVDALFASFMPKIDEYNAGTAEYAANIVGAGRRIDKAELQKLETAAAICNPAVDVGPVRGSFQEIGLQLSAKTLDMNVVLAPLMLDARRIIDSITDDTTDKGNLTRFSDLKDKCVEIARTYREIKEDSDFINGTMDHYVDTYRQLFDTTQQKVLDNIRGQITGLAVSNLPSEIEEGQRLLGEIGDLLASVN